MVNPNIVFVDASVTLRRLTLEDAADLAFNLNDVGVLKWLRDRVPNPYGIEDAHFFINEVAPKQEVFAVLHEERFAGVCGAHFQSDVYAQTMEIGYWLGRSHWGKGIASRAVALVANHVEREHLNIVRLEAGVFEGNLGSARVLEKNGFILECVRKKRVFKMGVTLDELSYARSFKR
jgi:[ribosomal protein S5]-alanine N-acetyltransferase